MSRPANNGVIGGGHRRGEDGVGGEGGREGRGENGDIKYLS